MAFPNFYGRKFESTSNFLDDLEMAILVSGRDEEVVKIRALPLLLREEDKTWFQGLQADKKFNWDTLKVIFMSKYGGGNNPEELWQNLSSLQQAMLGCYHAYESQFLKLWTK